MFKLQYFEISVIFSQDYLFQYPNVDFPQQVLFRFLALFFHNMLSFVVF